MAQIYTPYVRPYYGRPLAQQSNIGQALEGGLAIGKEVGGLAQAIKGMQQRGQMDTAANTLMNQVDPQTEQPVDESGQPVDPNDIDADMYNWGSAQPHSGGVDELNTMIAMRRAAQQLGAGGGLLQDQLKQAQIAAYLAKAKGGVGVGSPGTGDWQRYLANQPGAAGQPATGARGRTAQAGTTQQPFQIGTTPATDQSQISNYVDSTYGKGTFGNVMQNLPTVDLKTNPGFANFTVGTGKTARTISIPQDDYTTIGKQINQLRIRNGQAPLDLNAGGAPNPQNPPGTLTNPYPTKNTLDVSAVPPGQYYVDPQGQTRQRQTTM